jgi:hypothetical protein
VPGRADLVPELVALIGPGAKLIDAATGWPCLIDLDVDEDEPVRLAAHLGPVHSMARRGVEDLENRPEELRFQTPGPNRPPTAPPGSTPILIGLLPSIGGDPRALVVPSNPRLGLTTRFSVRFPGSLAYEGSRSGWARHTATGGEEFWAITPPALSALVISLREKAALPTAQARAAIQSAGALQVDDETKERTRVAASRLARSASFRPKVLNAYGGRCALCGLASSFLLEAAHIFPVSLPGSSDSVSNGIPVCLHHHAMLDRHLVYIDPSSLAVEISPALQAETQDQALNALLASTQPVLSVPRSLSRRDVKRWLQKRYEAFPADYGWRD